MPVVPPQVKTFLRSKVVEVDVYHWSISCLNLTPASTVLGKRFGNC